MTKTLKKYVSSLREALEAFDIKVFKKWVKKYNPALYKSFSKASEEVQMATICKCICNRTDMLNTEVHRKAVVWLRDHNMRGQIW